MRKPRSPKKPGAAAQVVGTLDPGDLVVFMGRRCKIVRFEDGQALIQGETDGLFNWVDQHAELPHPKT